MNYARPIGLLLVLVLTLAASSAWARLVTDEMGRQVKVPAQPQRIIGLTPSLTEVVFALGLGERAVGATTWADYPPAARKLTRVGPYVSPNLERILALKPDLVLINKDGNPPWLVDRLGELGVPVYVTVPTVPQDLPAGLERLGDLLGAPQAGRRLADKLRREMEQVAARLRGVKPRPTLMVIGSHPLVSVGPETMNGHLLTMAGAKNIAAGINQRWPRLNLEYITEAKPQVIILSTMERGQNLERDLTYWRTLPGVGDRPGVRVEWISSDLIDRPGPRMGQGLEELARLVHPERFTPEAKP
ncbi:ABC transporter substrate-binding protein [Desulfoferula mesophila]|uniref:Cobalamin-binding protein n=1 Tax=Desulfoferula mesophila TaxID=3058419 RepID=A0AAU9EI05_9BACT|nr:cobalamin-binding protein [Desulfoferula mesophilus]